MRVKKKALTYKSAGVNIAAGDDASCRAGKAAATTKKNLPKGRVAVSLSGGFAGGVKVGGYIITASDDTVGTKIEVAERMNDFSTLGADLCAMVADDTVCVGAEVLMLSNTIECDVVQPKKIEAMVKSLAAICKRQGIVIPGGEIAELGSAVHGYAWGGHATGIAHPKKVITGKGICAGDAVIGLREKGLRCNGLSLARAILQRQYGNAWHNKLWRGKKWGTLLLTPSTVYHAAVLNIIGRHTQKEKVNIKGICHITGGGIPGNALRMIKKPGLGLRLHNLWPAPDFVKELMRMGGVTQEEARNTWNLGTGMIMVVKQKDAEKVTTLLKKEKISARIVGQVEKGEGIRYV